MGVLNDLVIAGAEEAEAVGRESSPLNKWDGLDSKGLSQIEFGTLFEIVSGREPGEESFLECEQLFEAESGELWVWQMPEEFLRAMRTLDISRIPMVAASWVATEELTGASVDEMAAYIGALRDLARKANEA